IITPVLDQSSGLKLLSDKIEQQQITSKQAAVILEVLARKWIEAPDLRNHLNSIDGKKSTIPNKYENDYVVKLAKEFSEHRNAGLGDQVYQEISTCASCHSMNGKGGNIGPDLSALGRGLSPAEIIVEVLWPAQNIKEGYNRV